MRAPPPVKLTTSRTPKVVLANPPNSRTRAAPVPVLSSSPVSSPSPISCINCGYAITGLAPNSRCPECAYPIEISATGHRELGVAIAHPTALARLLRLLGILQLGFSLWFVLMVFCGIGRLHLKSNIVEPLVYCLGLALWLAVSIASSFVSARVVARTPRNSFALLVALRTASCALLIAAIAFVLGTCASGALIFQRTAFGCVALASITELIVAPISTKYAHSIIQSLPFPLRTELRTLNAVTIVSFYLAFISGVLYFASPFFLSLIPLAPAFASLRSFIFSRRLRAAIGER